MADWITCSSCNLKHSARADGTCPRCHQHAGFGGAGGGGAGSVSNNPFQAPAAATYAAGSYAMPVVAPGSFTVGFVLGFFLGLWGWLGCLVFAKQDTKRGSGYGFLARIGVTVVVALAVVAAQ